jgi:putative transposase
LNIDKYRHNEFSHQNIDELEKRFVSEMEFPKWLNNEYLPENLELWWIKEVSSKAAKQAIMHGETAFPRVLAGESKFPKLKKDESKRKGLFPQKQSNRLNSRTTPSKNPYFWIRPIERKGVYSHK